MFTRQQSTAKNPANYEMQNQQDFEQKPIKNFDQFTDTEEKEIKSKLKNEMLNVVKNQKR